VFDLGFEHETVPRHLDGAMQTFLEARNSPVGEQEVEVVAVGIERDALLPLNEREGPTKLEEEALDLAANRRSRSFSL